MGKFIGIGLIVLVLLALGSVAMGAVGRAGTIPAVIPPDSEVSVVNVETPVAEAANGGIAISDATMQDAILTDELTDAQTRALEIQASIVKDNNASTVKIVQSSYAAIVAVSAQGFTAVTANTFLFIGGGCVAVFLLWKLTEALGKAGKRTEKSGGE
jgi:hypothetical protein